jgi:uncharacterized protein (TIGR02147 family)
MAHGIATKLGYSKKETAYFLDLVHLEDEALSITARGGLQQKIDAYRAGSAGEKRLPIDAFCSIADWHHLGLLQSLSLTSIPPAKELARRLGIPTSELRTTYERLERLGLVKRKGSAWVPTYATTVTADEIPSEAIRRFHRQIMSKATRAIDTQGVDRRYLRSSVVTVRRENLAEAKDFLDACNAEFMRRFDRASAGDAVYALAIQMFDALEPEAP